MTVAEKTVAKVGIANLAVGGCLFAATEKGAECYIPCRYTLSMRGGRQSRHPVVDKTILELDEYRYKLDKSSIVQKSDKGYLYRDSAGDYPYSSSVVLIWRVGNRYGVEAYPTEINPRGKLEVDSRMEKILGELAD